MSFTDPTTSTSWSALFDSEEHLVTVLRVLCATVGQLCSLSVTADDGPSAANAQPLLRFALPPAVEADEVPLAAGMSAGVHYKAWELGYLGDYPSDLIAVSALAASREVLRVK